MKNENTIRKTKKSHGQETPAANAAELIDMEQAIAVLRTTRPTFYRWLRGGKFTGMKVGRQWRFYRKDIEAFLKGAGPRIDLVADISPLETEVRRRLREMGVDFPKCADDEEPVALVVREMIELAVRSRASDLHLGTNLCGSNPPEGVLRLRIDGCLHIVAQFDAKLTVPLVEQFKRLAACNVTETRLPQDGRVYLDIAGERVVLRMSFLPSLFGETVTVRSMERGAPSLKLDDLPYSAHDRSRIQTVLNAPYGLVLCSGPTGSGKTTSLYACLQTVSTPERKIVTVEDPVEYAMPWTTQIPVHDELPVIHALRAMLRADPDVLLVGEIRDREVLQLVFQSALSGHLVLSQMHTDGAVDALVRELELGVNPFLVADCPQLVIAQRLVRKLCQDCAVPCKPTSDEIEDAASLLPSGMENPLIGPTKCRQPVGCPKCAMTGYRGRTLVAETLRMSPEIGRALRLGASADQLRDLAIAQGMVPMAADGVARVARGETTLSELRRLFAGGTQIKTKEPQS